MAGTSLPDHLPATVQINNPQLIVPGLLISSFQFESIVFQLREQGVTHIVQVGVLFYLHGQRTGRPSLPVAQMHIPANAMALILCCIQAADCRRFCCALTVNLFLNRLESSSGQAMWVSAN